MNQSIGCGPMPFALVSDKAAAESATLLPGANASSNESETSFREVLDSEIQDAKPEKERNQVEPWTVYGIASTSGQIPPAGIALSIPSMEAFEGAQGAGESAPQDHLEKLIEHGGTKGEVELVERTEDTLKMRLETLKLVEQKVPSPLEPDLKGGEQIAENLPKPAKISYGMVAAQGELMVSVSPKQEETALEQNLLLSAEVFADSDPEQPVALRPASKEATLKSDIHLADFAPIESSKSEWSSFDGISETSEPQPVKANGSIEIAEAIRTHVQVLKGSSQEKLDVVLRPDGQTELRLQVEKVNGQILVQARCDRGDFARLESNWSAVQQSLANQGVRVESLEHSNFSQSPHNFQNSSGRFDERPTDEHHRDTYFIEHKVKASKNQTSITSRGTVQGWQRWA